jgi:RNA polymerase sigma-70 factor, ECF subfamily
MPNPAFLGPARKISDAHDTDPAMTPAIANLSPPAERLVPLARDDVGRAERQQIIAARAGDRASMRAIYETEAPRLLRRLRHLTGDPVRAQDLTHDVFVVAFSGRAPFDGTASQATWLYGIALNKLRNDRRKSQRRRRLLAAAPEPRAQAPGAASDAVVLDELQRSLDAALAELTDGLREAFVLRVIEALSLREAATLAGVSESTMSKRASKAEARVRAALEHPNQSEENSR